VGATLDTGGWLVLARQGLSPCKMHQALLGARHVFNNRQFFQWVVFAH